MMAGGQGVYCPRGEPWPRGQCFGIIALRWSRQPVALLSTGGKPERYVYEDASALIASLHVIYLRPPEGAWHKSETLSSDKVFGDKLTKAESDFVYSKIQ